jgi:hypothetical protein
LDFLGFIRPNRDFSKGYERKNKKNRLASQVVCEMSQVDASPSSFRQATPRKSSIRLAEIGIAYFLDFEKQLLNEWVNPSQSPLELCAGRRWGRALGGQSALAPRLINAQVRAKALGWPGGTAGQRLQSS